MEKLAEKAVLFVDVSGSTRLYESAGDAVAHAAIDKCIVALRQSTTDHGGRVVKTIGDEVMSVFPDASSATDAAVNMQEMIGELPPVGTWKLGVRIGFHYGPVVEHEGDVFGDAVNLSARLAGLAAKGQIMTSRETVNRMTPTQKVSTRRLYSIQVKGKENEVDLYEILWQLGDDHTMLSSNRTLAKQKQFTLRLKYLDRELVLAGTKTSITLGREASTDLIIIDRMASRSHGKIECRLGKFVFADHSANGTFVTIGEEPEITLRREEIILRGRGYIAFGQSRAAANESAEFICE